MRRRTKKKKRAEMLRNSACANFENDCTGLDLALLTGPASRKWGSKLAYATLKHVKVLHLVGGGNAY